MLSPKTSVPFFITPYSSNNLKSDRYKFLAWSINIASYGPLYWIYFFSDSTVPILMWFWSFTPANSCTCLAMLANCSAISIVCIWPWVKYVKTSDE